MKKLLTALLVVTLLLPMAAPVFADASYIVQPGDNLFRIGLRYGVTVTVLKAANGLSSDIIYVGQRLTIPGVSGSTTPTGSTSPATNAVYVVLGGDNLFRIGIKYGVSVAALKAANGLTSDLIYVGQRLTIPGVSGAPAPTAVPGATSPAPTAVPPTTAPPAASTYTVQRGDTLWGISIKFGVTVAALKAANGLTSDVIFPGQVLKLPGGSSGSVAPTAVPAPGSTAVPTVKPPTTTGTFELGGQVSGSNFPDKMKYSGMYWVKQQVHWSPTAKASDWTTAINNAHAQGFKLLLSVNGDAANISGGANFDNYAFYVGELARLGADAIEVWNEMNLDREWPAGQINPVTYVSMLQKSYAQIKAKNANTLVISGAPSPTGAEGAFGLDHVWNDNRYIAGMAAAGAANYADCIGVHYNEGIVSPTQSTGDPRDNYYTRYYPAMVSTYFNAFGGARKLCFTELGYLTPEGYAPLPAFFGWAGGNTLAEQAQWLGEAANLAKNGGTVRLLIVFNVDFTVYGEDPQAGFAIIRPGGGCPACDSLRAVTGGR